VAGGVLHGCGGGSPAGPSGGNGATALPVVSASASGGTVSVTVDAGSPLASVGSPALVQTNGGSFLVARTAQDSFTVLTATCTHEACMITGHNGQIYVCPCHGSQFNASGGVVNGPATRPLASFPATFSANVLSFNV
jgi:Rieske Fe-S protein